MPRVELSGAADNGDGARRHESIAKAIYGREELDRQGDIDVTDVLQRLPGVSMDKGATAEFSGVAGTINVVLREPPRSLQREWRNSQLRIGVVNLLAPDNSSASSVEDLDGFFAESSSRRETLRVVAASWVLRY